MSSGEVGGVEEDVGDASEAKHLAWLQLIGDRAYDAACWRPIRHCRQPQWERVLEVAGRAMAKGRDLLEKVEEGT